MMYPKRLVVAASLAALQLSGAHAQNQDEVNPCRAIMDEQKQNLRSANATYPTDMKYLVTFNAKKAYECITSVPLVAEEASTMIDVFKNYFSLQSSLAYLKDPPKSYQRLPVDVMGRFDEIKTKLESGEYKNQYEFDLAVQSIIRDVNDYHFYVYSGVLGLFHWTLPDSLTAISSDGQSLPQLFAWSDITNNVQNASAVVELDGKPAFAYLRGYLERTYFLGFNDPNADWNSLMENPAADFSTTGRGKQSLHYSAFQTTQIYNGVSLGGRFANGSEFEWKYKAGSTRDLTRYRYYNGSAIYGTEVKNRNSTYSSNFASRANLEKEYELHVDSRELEAAANWDRAVLASRSAVSSVPYFGYPSDPDLVQSDFGEGGMISGYFLRDDKIGVLSVPSFQTSSDASPATFSSAVRKFIREAQSAGMEKIVIDVMGNRGGSLLLAYDMFRLFFPSALPNTLFRARASSDLKTLGNIVTNVINNSRSFDSFDAGDITVLGAAGELNTEVLLKADNSSWDSYDEYFGPLQSHGDNFTKNAQYNLDSRSIARSLGFYVAGYGNNVPTYNETWKAENVVLLSDGLCGSTCAVLHALMKNDAGVKSVVVGGVPGYGPMQVAGGTRGHNVRTLDALSDVKTTVQYMISLAKNPRQVLSILGVTAEDVNNLPMTFAETPWRVGGGGINALDTVIRAKDDVPRQFVYEGANCRLFWTGERVRDISKLWRAAVTYASGNSTICVPGSVDGPGSKANATVTDDVGVSYQKTWDKVNSTDVPKTTNTGSDKQQGNDDSAASTYGVGMTGLMTIMFVWALWL